MMSDAYKITLQLPAWLGDFVDSKSDEDFSTREKRMGFVIEASRLNVVNGTGGPFAAAVFERDSGRLIAPATNIVVPSNTSVAHAETMAFMLAQQRLETFDLGAAHLAPMELFASSQPCIQCFGNTWWSGVQALTIGARTEDVEEITDFKEGPLPADWVALLENREEPLRPIRVERDVLRSAAREVLLLYRDSGGLVYNAGSGGIED
jgi:tRNA(Arg) A34 adenosine deaminase TadA